ncbi:biosynthetic-type acetolactate synthase large subunit [Clostridium thailandense]|uniref:biosynthetic-type acetolactate synthase large subunit n=1 Tax=Clostridium thailandense TaxID=2794346 RepID=UPI003988B42A
MKVSQAIIQCLYEENVDTVFGYPGATILPLYEALRESDIKHILVRQEQAAGHSASGFARAKKTVGVCIVTSGPGATNLITAIATAYMDSIPLVIITGQVKTTLIGKDVFQEADVTGATDSFTKHNYLVKCAEDIPMIMKEAFYIARTGRPGPVLIDIPVDIQSEEIEFSYPEEVNIRGYKPKFEGHKGQIKRAAEKIMESRKPLICVGGGIISGEAEEELRQFVNKAEIPVVHTLMGKGSISEDNNHYIGLIGSHGFSYANKTVSEADLLILIGTRAADRAIAGSNFGKEACVIHIDIDPAEIGKVLGPNIPVVGHAKKVLKELIKEVRNVETKEWIEQIEAWKKESEKTTKLNEGVNPKYIFSKLSEMVGDDTIITADVGQNQIWCARNFRIKGHSSFFTSGGLGTMGYSLPAAVGAKMGDPSRRVIAVMGDGGFQMSIAELGTITDNNVNITILLFNNSVLGMVRELQKNVYGSGKYCGVNFKSRPDFIKIAEGYGLRGKRVNKTEDFEEAFREAIKYDGAFVIECIVDSDESTF